MKKRVRFLGLLIVVLFSLSGCAAAGGGSLSSEAGGEAAPAPVPAPKLLDVETGALEITGAPLDGLELDFIREEFKDIAALKEREDAAYRRGEAAAPSTLGVLAFSCDLDENGQTDYLAFPVGFGYTATMDQHSTGVFFVADAGGYRTFSGVPFAAVHSLKIYLLESKTGGMHDLFYCYPSGVGIVSTYYNTDSAVEGYGGAEYWAVCASGEKQCAGAAISPQQGLCLVAERLWKDEAVLVGTEARLRAVHVVNGKEEAHLDWALGPVEKDGGIFYRYYTSGLFSDHGEDFYLVDAESGEVYRETEDGIEAVEP